MTEDQHIDLAYALTVYGVQGASERFAIALTGTEGGRKRMVSLESTYVTLSRAKEHVQVYTDDLAGWSTDARHSNAGQTAHDLLHQKSDHESDTGIHFCRDCVRKGFVRAVLYCCCVADRLLSVPGG